MKTTNLMENVKLGHILFDLARLFSILSAILDDSLDLSPRIHKL